MIHGDSWKKRWEFLKIVIDILAFTGLWIFPVMHMILPKINEGFSALHIWVISLAIMGWVLFNNTWSMVCEGKQLKEFVIGDGLIPDLNISKEPLQKRSAMYPAVPTELLSTEPAGIILGKWKSKYVRIPLDKIYHYCILGGPGSGKTSTVLLDTLLSNFATKKNTFQVFAIDIKGELNQKSTYRLFFCRFKNITQYLVFFAKKLLTERFYFDMMIKHDITDVTVL